MRVAVVNESSAARRNDDILDALGPLQFEIVNAGMKSPDDPPLNYIQTAFLGALILNAGRADYLVGGCATGQGFFNAVLQYPNVVCGLTTTPLDAWLFARVNAGNCVSLRLNQGYGWGEEINLRLMFQSLFAPSSEVGYPSHRREVQEEGRAMLAKLTAVGHRPMAEIVGAIDGAIIDAVLEFPGVWELLDVDTLADRALAIALEFRRAVVAAR